MNARLFFHERGNKTVEIKCFNLVRTGRVDADGKKSSASNLMLVRIL
jgi:hypothetical protein